MEQRFEGALRYQVNRETLHRIAARIRLGKAVLVSDLMADLKRPSRTIHAQLDRLQEDGLIMDVRAENELRVVELTAKGRRMVRYISSPILGPIPAGLVRAPTECDGIDVEGEQKYLETWDDRLPPTEDFCVFDVRGDSMIGDHLCDGDEVQLRRVANGRPITLRDVRPGQIAAVMVGTECEGTLKRVFFDREAGIVTLRASNRAYKDIRAPASEVRVVGVFRGLVRLDPEEVNTK